MPEVICTICHTRKVIVSSFDLAKANSCNVVCTICCKDCFTCSLRN